MKYKEIFRCPDCRGSLQFTDGIDCVGCKREFSAARGVPRFLPRELVDKELATQKSFGLEWKVSTRYFQTESIYHNARHFFTAIGRPEQFVRGKLMLDAGCGPARFSKVAAENGARVVSVDLTEEAVIAARNLNHPCIQPAQASLMRLPFADGVYDIVYNVGVLHHIREPEAGMRELVRVLKPGGLLIVGVYKKYRGYQVYERLRRCTTRMPVRLVYALSHLAIPFAHIPVLCYGFYPWVTPYDHWRMKVIETYDHYTPPYQRYYSFQEIDDLFLSAGMPKPVHTRVGSSVAKKPT